jgi:TRAP-type C4-dicarboxylate transport system permease small subunit
LSRYRSLAGILEVVLVALFALLVLDVLLQVFTRYVLSRSFAFTEELARFSLIWMTLLGAAYLVGKKEHLTMDFLLRNLSDKRRVKTEITISFLVALFALVVMVIGGSNLVYITLRLEQVSPAMRVPLGYVYAVLPMSGLMILYYCAVRLNAQISALKAL